MVPLFIFSLPRSGSTLLQRILMSHKDIASVAEPWLLLPLIYSLKQDGVLTEYVHVCSYKGLEDFIKNLPNKDNDYFKALSIFVNTLYEKQCRNNEIYFLDKTPRYYLIIPEIAKIFPNAKFIFLFRNPVQVMSSIIQTWSNGTLMKLYSYHRDLNYGPKALSEGFNLLKDKSYAIQYEEFLTQPKKYIHEICSYLQIDFDENMLNTFCEQDIKGRFGDPTGSKEYKSIEKKSLIKWKKTFNTKFRKKLVFDYINSIDDSVLTTQGYSKKGIIDEIENLKVTRKGSLQDRLHMQYSNFVRVLKN
ncbi:MAG: sulfotransferase [Pseudomonadota bacterium]